MVVVASIPFIVSLFQCVFPHKCGALKGYCTFRKKIDNYNPAPYPERLYFDKLDEDRLSPIKIISDGDGRIRLSLRALRVISTSSHLENATILAAISYVSGYRFRFSWPFADYPC